MSLYSRIMTEHKNWLQEKGFDEEKLDSMDQPGTMVAQLQDKLFQVVVETMLSNDPVEFSVSMTGYFNDRRDKVRFEFAYSYDPDRTQLHLMKMTAQLDATTLEIPIWNNNRRELLPADKVYQKLFLKSKQLPTRQASAPALGSQKVKR